MGNFDFIETDKRILEQKLRQHQLTQQDLLKLLKNLPDDQEMAEELVSRDQLEGDSDHSG